MLNLKPLDNAITYIEQHPREWAQDVYREPSRYSPTGERGCLAYHICKQAGAVFPTDNDKWASYWEVRNPMTGHIALISNFAQWVLGINEFATAMQLFLSSNSLTDIKSLRNRLYRFGDVMPAPVGVLAELSAF